MHRCTTAAVVVALMVFSAAPATCDALGPFVRISPAYQTNGVSGIRGGRFSAVVIDPVDGHNAYATSDAGGVYVSHDFGLTWRTTYEYNGNANMIGVGFSPGVHRLNDLAISPDGSTLLLIADDDGTRTNAAAGIWRSTDLGRTWVQSGNGNPTAPSVSSCAVLKGGGKVLFSQSSLHAGSAYATAGCSLGISTDSGATWTWINPVGGGDQMVWGLDLFDGASGSSTPDLFGRTSGEDIAALCVNVPNALADGTPSSRSILLIDPNHPAVNVLLPAPKSDLGGGCSVAFDSTSGRRVFVATGGVSGISQGDIATAAEAITVNYTDLSAPAPQSNGRPVFVQTTVLPFGQGVRLYYHDTVNLMYQDCLEATHGCAGGPPKWPHCPYASSPQQPWQCVATQHTDAARLAFGIDHADCVLLANDGGLESSSDCGSLWSATTARGLAAQEPWRTSFAGSGTSVSILMALQDNGVQWTTDSGQNWHGSICGDGFSADAIRSDPTQSVYVCDGNLKSIVDGSSKDIAFPPIIQSPCPLQQCGAQIHLFGNGIEGAYVQQNIYVIPFFTPLGQLELAALDVRNQTYAPYRAPTTKVFSPLPTSGGGDIAAGGRDGAIGVAVYVLLPGTGGTPALPHQLWVSLPSGAWVQATGLGDPVRVWASGINPLWAYCFDAADNSAYVATDGVSFVRDDLLTEQMTANGDIAGNVDSVTSIMDTVAFDPEIPGRVAVGTTRNGIVATEDGGHSWAHLDAFPTPNLGVSGIYFDSSISPAQNAYAAGFGQGVWAIWIHAPLLTLSSSSPVLQGTSVRLTGVLKTGSRGVPLRGANVLVSVIDRAALDRLPPLPPAPPEIGPGAEQTVLTPIPGGLGVVQGFGAPVTPGPSSPRKSPPSRSGIIKQFIAPTRTDANGRIVIDVPHLPRGDYFLEVTYAGDADNPSVSAQVDLNLCSRQVRSEPGLPDFARERRLDRQRNDEDDACAGRRHHRD